MSVGPLDRAGLVPVAYARVNVNGDSPASSSNVAATERLSPGVYKITLQPEMSMSENDSYLSVQPWHYPVFCSVQMPDPSYYLVQFFDAAGNPANTDFTVAIYSTVVPPVVP